MKVTLIVPNYKIREKFGDPSDPPLGVTSIAAVLEEQGYDVSVVDGNAENLTVSDIQTRLKMIHPDVVGISCNYSPLHYPTLEIAALVKKKLGVPVMVGGNHATALAEYILQGSPDIDVVIRGEGEITFPALVQALQNGLPIREIQGITFREGGQIVTNPDAPLIADLDTLPIPAYHLLPMPSYRRYNIVAARGCPFQCSYCASEVIFRRLVRYRSPKKVVEEIAFLVQQYGKKHIWFSDDTFITTPGYTARLLDELISSGLDLQWSCLTRVNRVTRKMLEKMKVSGCHYISYGIESGNPSILDRMGKKITLDQIRDTLHLTHEVGIKQYGFFMVGFPGETWEMILDSYKLIYETPLDGAAFNILIPLPGTPLFKELSDAQLITLDKIEWDYLFARTPQESYESFSARLASAWSGLSSTELIEACEIGHRLPEIFKYVKAGK